MEHLSKKLHSQRGASILMALLMLLVCMMVAASILGAAASNAGKIRSNRVEQQKYLTLSSAIRLVADEIQKATYTGKYRVYAWTITTTVEEPVKNGAGSIVGYTTVSTTTEDFFHVEQLAGVYSCGVKRTPGANGELTTLIPLGTELDTIFSEQFTGRGVGYSTSVTSPVSPAPHILTVTLDGLPADAGPEVYAIGNVVTVRVELDPQTRHIKLTAWLGTDPAPPDDGRNTMTAELVARITEGTELVPGVLTVGYAPEGRMPCGKGGPDGSFGTVTDATGRITTKIRTGGAVPGENEAIGAPMQWELHWIRKGAV